MFATLILIDNSHDADGFPARNEERIEVYATEKSVHVSEFYSAMQVNISPKIVLVLRVEDWELSRRIVNSKPLYATKVEWEGCIYDVVRTYKKDKSKIEITLA